MCGRDSRGTLLLLLAVLWLLLCTYSVRAEEARYWITESQLTAMENLNREQTEAISQQKRDIERLRTLLNASEAERIESARREARWATYSERLESANASTNRELRTERAIARVATGVAGAALIGLIVSLIFR
jgi:septal ring factor EnvC (AmiA/AmiB activator)